MIKKFFNIVTAQRQQDHKAELYRNLIRHEAKIGGGVFGAVPANRRREFFCLDEHTWVWHEEWTDKQGQTKAQTTRYDVRPTGILKAQGGRYQSVSNDESRRLIAAAKLYRARVYTEMYPFAR